MRKTGKAQVRQRFMEGIVTLALVMMIVLFGNGLAIVSHAQSQGRVTATSANIRKEPSSSSEVVGSTLKDKIITINSQVQGSDGHIWYQTFVNSETLGYIRSDLVEIIDGSTPTTTTPGTTTVPENPTVPGELEALNPVSATVKGGNSVRIRSTATDSEDNIVKTVANGLVVTVTGRATDSKGKVWFQVTTSDNGVDVTGFIREDFVTVEGELTPYVDPTPVDPPADDPGVTDPEPPAPSKDYDTALIDGEWYLQDFGKNEQHKISLLFETAESNSEAYKAEHKKAETEKIVIIILVFLLVAAASGIAMLIFKIKDMSDDAYFNQVERETLRRRGETRQQGASRKVMHTVGGEKAVPGKPGGTRPAGSQGARPAGTTQGQRPAGGVQGSRPSGTSQGVRPSGAAQGQRPGGSIQGNRSSGIPQGQRSGGNAQGARPSGASQGQRPAGQRPSDSARGSRPAEGRQSASGQKPVQGWQSKNFMSEEDDEFEFGFLNYDGAEEK